MIKAFTGRIRQILPSSSWMTGIMFLFVCIELIWVAIHQAQGPGPASDRLIIIRDHAILVLVAVFAVFRVIAFHPLCRPEYRDWLKMTPWKKGTPLPLGPVHPFWADVLLVGAAAMLLADPRQLLGPPGFRPSPLTAVMMFGMIHAAAVSVVVWLTQPRSLAYITWFLLALAIQVRQTTPMAAAVAMLLGWLAALYGLNLSWNIFPWNATIDWGTRLKNRWNALQNQKTGAVDDQISPDRVPASELGWPFSVMSPWVPPASFSKPEQLLICVLIGWWMRALMIQIPDKEFVIGIGGIIVGYGTIILVFVKVSFYGSNLSSPIGFWGRILTLRWIIRGYDKVILAPLSILATAISVGLICHFLIHLQPHTVFPITTVATLWTFILAGPDPQRWKLTAPAKIVHGRLNKRTYDQLT